MSETALGICYGDMNTTLREDAEIAEPFDFTLAMTCCPGKRRMYRCYVPSIEGVWSPSVHSNCQHNEYAALALRTMGQTPDDPVYNGQWHPEVTRQFYNLRNLARRINVERWGLDETAASYKGRLGRRYKQALAELEDTGLEPRDWRLSAFLKGEKFNATAKKSKPRMICPRTPKYNLLLASYLKPLEHAIWSRWKFGHRCVPSRVSGKGLNSGQRAGLIRRKMAAVGDCVVFEVDGKAFEAHVTLKQLELEQGIYKAAYPGEALLNDLLDKQRCLDGKTAGGYSFFREGCRASGDFNTGMGNTILMASFSIAAVLTMELDCRWTVLADGDNCLLFVERAKADLAVTSFASAMASVCGHEMAVERPVTVLEEVTFGQSNPVLTDGGWRMVRNPFKVLAGAFSGYRYYNDRVFAPRLIGEIAYAEACVNAGVPVLGPYFDKAVGLTRKYKPLKRAEDFLEGHLLNVPKGLSHTISMEARLSFELAFGIGVAEQLSLERRLIDGLENELNDVLESGRWLKTLVYPQHGTILDEGEDANDYMFWDAVG